MGLVDEFENRIEKVVEGFFTRAFKSKVQPAEIGKKLLRSQESGKTVSVDATYVPNVYEVTMAEEDLERFEGLESKLVREFGDLLRANARERRWGLPGALLISFASSADVKPGRFQVEASHRDDSSSEAPPLPKATLSAEDSGSSWELKAVTTIGRAEGCDIVVDDPEASRNHASIQSRDDGWWVSDLGSTNHTYVNGTITKERRLASGDVIGIGGTSLRFEEVS